MSNPNPAALLAAKAFLTQERCNYDERADGTLFVHDDIILVRDTRYLPDLSTVEVGGHFLCMGTGLASLKGGPFKVRGSFLCSDNALTSLEGAPAEVGGDFDCSSNKITSPDYAPIVVTGDFRCQFNKITSLEGMPKGAHSVSCDFNELLSLKGAPEEVEGLFSCGHNKLETLEHAPRRAAGGFYCEANRLTSLKGAPQVEIGDFNCSDNMLASLEYAPADAVIGTFSCEDNPLSSLEGAPKKFHLLSSSFGKFRSWDEVPERFRESEETRRSRRMADVRAAAESATVLATPLRARRPFRLKGPVV